MATTTTITREIAAAPEVVFDAVAHIEQFSEIVPEITAVEFLTDTHRGMGAQFTETRVMEGRESSTTLEITEYDAPHRVRLVSDEGGAVWDTVFLVEAVGEGARLKMTMEARPHTFRAKATVPLIRGVIARAVASDMDAVKSHCEAAPVASCQNLREG